MGLPISPGRWGLGGVVKSAGGRHPTLHVLQPGMVSPFSRFDRSGGICPFAPPPRPLAAAQTVPRCFGAIRRRRGAGRGQKPARSPKGKARVSRVPSRPGNLPLSAPVPEASPQTATVKGPRRGTHVGTTTSDRSSLPKLEILLFPS